MKHLKFAAAALAVMLVTAATPGRAADDPPVVVELFTSQGCYSCPPAEAFLGELAERPDVVALEFHVDYWDTLNYMWHGQWKDPFSSPDHTRRQRLYNVAIRGQSGVYTPQMVIDGRLEAVGSHRDRVTDILRRAAATKGKLTVAVAAADGRLKASVSGGAAGSAEIHLVRFLNRVTTEVKKGENHGKVLESRHIVREIRRIGAWHGDATAVDLPKDARKGAGMGCAVLVQAPDHGPVLGAALCPKGPPS
ncbi:MAG: DUF1223 domain-containing protein [Rhodospirillales bacterium CG15_BIG_FIL_POST_REV_8_21_14_020_66_15]|nr:MAG: DUF1223 domain-containing protein [Rhodospirillales bacterium CG15_BIG_FIL_POST_REV_8_21_14_020_66_15]